MILLTRYWPGPQQTWRLEETACARFNPSDASFSPHHERGEEMSCVVFKPIPEGVELTNDARNIAVYVDGVSLSAGEQRILKSGSAIQIDRFGIAIEEEGDILQPLPGDREILNSEPLPELNDILRNSFLHVGAESDEAERNILKTLEKEFRQALIWGIQKVHLSQNGALRAGRIAENALDFDTLQARVKSETVTHCIFESSRLIHKIFDEMKLREEDTLKPDEPEKSDVLRLLATEEMRYDMKKRIPVLLVQEIYRADLDTLL